jgi:hypothetical protein
MCFQSQFPYKSVNLVRIPTLNLRGAPLQRVPPIQVTCHSKVMSPIDCEQENPTAVDYHQPSRKDQVDQFLEPFPPCSIPNTECG